MTRKLIGIVALSALLLGTAACGDSGGSGAGTVWYSTKNSTEKVHVAMADGVTQAAKDLGYDSQVVVAEADAARQNDQLNNIVLNMSPKAVVINPYDSDAVADVLKRAKEAKIPFAVIDNKATYVQPDISVLFDSIKSGEAAGQKAVEILTKKYGSPKGTVVDLYGEVVSQVFKERAQGFEDTIKKYPDIKLISVLGAPQADTATSALNNVLADAKSSNTTIDLVNTPTDSATLGVVESLKSNNLWKKVGEEGHVAVISHDGLGDILKLVTDGYVDDEVVIDVFGVGGIATEVLNEYPIKGKPVPTSGTFTPKGKYLSKTVQFTTTDVGTTIMLAPIVVDTATASNPLIWGNAS